MPILLKLKATDEQPVVFLTLTELAKELGRTKRGLEYLIKDGLVPTANYRNKHKARLYSKEFLVPRLKTIFTNIGQGKRMTIEQQMAILDAFNEEIKHFNT